MIRFLKIANYRSIDVLELREIKPFSVFAGPNGAGKTNFFGALDFVNLIIRFGAEEALKKHGGFENIRCLRRRYEDASVFEFELVFELETENQQTETLTYHLEIRQLDTSHPFIEDYVLFNDKSYRKTDVMDIFRSQYPDFKEKNFYYSNNPCLPLVAPFLPHFRWYEIEPEKAKLPVKNYDDSELSHNGHNLAAVLNRLEKDDDSCRCRPAGCRPDRRFQPDGWKKLSTSRHPLEHQVRRVKAYLYIFLALDNQSQSQHNKFLNFYHFYVLQANTRNSPHYLKKFPNKYHPSLKGNNLCFHHD